MSELFLIFCVALIVFQPRQWPMLCYHLAQLFNFIQQVKQQAALFWHKQIAIYELENNQKKAAQVDEQYKNNNPIS